MFFSQVVDPSFRPLARWIGSYTKEGTIMMNFIKKFPSPREVDRFLYQEVCFDELLDFSEFPSPLEVDRFLYKDYSHFTVLKDQCFRPLAR